LLSEIADKFIADRFQVIAIANSIHDKFGNSRQLLSLLDLSTANHQFVAAEIHRNLGDFDNCISILNGIKKVDLAWVKEKLINECTQKNRWVIKLK
jgi:hypothetical protein